MLFVSYLEYIMKSLFNRSTLSVFIFLLSFSIQAQSQESFEYLIRQLQEELNEYSRLNPFENAYSLKDFSLDRKERKLLKADASDPLQSKDSISSMDLIWLYQSEIFKSLDKLLHHTRFEENDVLELLNFQDTDLHIARSEDQKLYSFSLAEKTGGTYRSRLSIMYYSETNKDSLPTIKSPIDSRSNDIFYSDGYGSIHSIGTEQRN